MNIMKFYLFTKVCAENYTELGKMDTNTNFWAPVMYMHWRSVPIPFRQFLHEPSFLIDTGIHT